MFRLIAQPINAREEPTPDRPLSGAMRAQLARLGFSVEEHAAAAGRDLGEVFARMSELSEVNLTRAIAQVHSLRN